MRVAFVHWAFTDVDPIGEGIITYEFAQALSRFVDIEVFYQRGRLSQMDALRRVKVNKFRWFERKYSFPFNLYTLTKLIFSKPIHLIHQFQYEKTLFSILNIPHVVSCFLPYSLYKRMYGIRNNKLGNERAKEMPLKLDALDSLFARFEYRIKKYILTDDFFISRVDYFIAHHNDMKKWLILNGCSQEKVTVIYPPVNINKFKPAASQPEFKKNRVLFVGRLDWRKSFHLLCDILPDLAKEVPEFELIICGDGPLRSYLYDTIFKRQPNLRRHIRYLGKVDRTLLPRIYRTVKLVCNPTYYESFGMVNLEAMSCGVPVVSTRTGAIPEVVTEDCGILIEAGDKIALKEAIIKISLDEKSWIRMRRHCRRHVVNNFSYEVIAPKVLKVYEKVCML